ncbi:MAG TPA: hypothetical protein VM733_22130 [Thermoanaerobaculia bacterium]|nr:hypothetical protein [Thermoanaerobaculia bacterium]
MKRMLIAALLLFACSKPETAERSAPAPAPPANDSVAAGPSEPPVAGVPNVTISGNTVDIAYGGQKLHGEQRDTGKRKYTVDGALKYEVKPNDQGGFKLRTADGKLLWKVRVTPEKIKISDNEENTNPFELKVRDAGRVKVVAPGDKELGNVRYDGTNIEVENAGGQKQFSIPAKASSGAYGVLLLDAIPAEQRAILVAEILSRGR